MGMSYYATGNNTTKCEEVAAGYYLEHNSAIGVWRINHDEFLPKELMGYSPHPRVLRRDIHNYCRRNKKETH